MNKNLLVYLHGISFDKSEISEFTDQLADKLDADKLAFDAPYESGRARGGYMWAYSNPDRTPILDERFYNTLDFIKSNVEKALNERGQNWDNVILSGKSQGAFIAMHMALSRIIQPRGVIALCAYDLDRFIANKIINKDIPVVWAEAENENLMPRSAMDGYIAIHNAGVKLERVILPDSDHYNLSLAGVPIVASAARKLGII